MYVPPHRRGNASGAAPPATLEELSASNPAVVEIKPEFNKDGPFNLEGCPFDVEESDEGPVIYFEYSSGRDGRRALLEWFKAKSEQPSEEFPQGDIKALLRMPPSLTNRDRALWHRDAEKLKLGSSSEGTGESRHLCIFTKTLASIGIGRLQSMLPGETRTEVKRIWNMCQMEGGKFWEYSQDEIAELLMSKTGLPEDIKQIYQKREKGSALCGLIRDGETEGALAILADDKRTAHMRDEVSGGFPIHLACFKNLEPVVERLLEIPGTLEQRDAMRCTALDVAKCRGFKTLTSLLENHGVASSLGSGDKKQMHLMADTYDSWQSKGERDFLLFGKSYGRGQGRRGKKEDRPSRWGSNGDTEKW
ncbi:hypothetical protein BSKO_04596 [Bryopsis sp. KO-2023]|nr:hypothetical protein BSKO_04596 [Bryopsis sp. KO-2023]